MGKCGEEWGRGGKEGEAVCKGVMHRDSVAGNVLVQSIDPVHMKVRERGEVEDGGGGGV